MGASTSGVKFSAGGNEYRLRFGFAAMLRYEQETGGNAYAALQALDDPLTEGPYFEKLVTLFWAMCSPALPDTLVTADIMDEIGFDKAAELLRDAAFAGVDGEPEKAKASKKRAPTSRG